MEMRQALTMALQSFGGAILLISHDRHLLANNVDQFLLIDDGEVQEYAGDLQDYSTRILANLSKSHPKKSAGKAKTPGANKKADQKLLRQIKAEIMGAEKRLKRLQEKIGEVEAVLQSPDTYDGNFQDDLHDLIRNQTELKSQIEEVEKVWLTANEKLRSCAIRLKLNRHLLDRMHKIIRCNFPFTVHVNIRKTLKYLSIRFCQLHQGHRFSNAGVTANSKS